MVFSELIIFLCNWIMQKKGKKRKKIKLKERKKKEYHYYM